MEKRLVFELTNIKKQYHNKTVLNIKHFQCHPGTIYGIIGPIGAGKTTLLKILGGRVKPSVGELRFEGENFQTNWFGKIKSVNDMKKILSPLVIPPSKDDDPDFYSDYGSDTSYHTITGKGECAA